MKKKLLSVVALLFVSIISTFALTEEAPAQRYNTSVCRMGSDPDSGYVYYGSKCSIPDKNGPCTTTSECRFSN